MNKVLLIAITCLMIAQMPMLAGDGGKTTVQAIVGTSPRAENTSKVMIQTAVVPAKSEDDKKPIAPPPPLPAADWVAAWQAAKETCPEASGMTIYYNDRSGPTPESLKVFPCVDMKARGELLVITIKQPGQKEESVAIVRASDVVRIDVSKPATANP
ncbi:MAG: hypothetical protein KKG09_09040 [Verrucomicrobia bacterium]|nr:hypothetical protein [Verrucomicrobiota bacterium]MBU4291097.1 hypothetical protein [Verrucomicrobiota bacterium]MBU4429353.1 hypothetical protein [Verrucomicrobiota bacterium]MBU4498134.1 hypothetical protein [Verrucomicrobiota bacterium]MCG2680114.1 hypothetical protein [Kiritimatiellia bacterium]